MSGGISCHCEERSKPVKLRNWAVLDRKCNRSYFEYPKGDCHVSDYSKVICWECGRVWRTKAKYVDELEDGEY